MTVSISDERVFEASADALFALLTDPAFQEARSRHLGTLTARGARAEEGAEIVVTLEETRDTGWPPHVFTSRLVTRWDPRTRRARWELAQLAGPGHAEARGTLAIVEDGGRTRLELEGTLRIRARLIGGLIERLATRALRAERTREARFVAAYLRGHSP